MKYKLLYYVQVKISCTAIARTPKEGAATTLNCAVNPDLNSQQALYYDSCKESPCNPDARCACVCVCVCVCTNELIPLTGMSSTRRSSGEGVLMLLEITSLLRS